MANDTVDCVHWQCFLEVVLRPVCDIHYISIPVCDAVPSKDPMIMGIQYGFPALTLMHRDCSRFSESLDDDMHCRWLYLQTLCNFCLRNSFVISDHYFLLHHLGNWWSSAHLDFWESMPLSEALFIPNHVANWPNKLQMGPQAVPYLKIWLFWPLIATRPNYFGMCSSHKIQNEPIFGITFQKVSLSTFAMLSIFYCEQYIGLWDL